jgi:hypothetical protein
LASARAVPLTSSISRQIASDSSHIRLAGEIAANA